MTTFQLVVIAMIQALTEFLPISSSGHLVLLPILTGWPDQGQTIDVAVHIGTLGAILVYFWRDVLRLLGGVLRLLVGRVDGAGRLVIQILVGTIPAVVVGGLLSTYADEVFRGAFGAKVVTVTCIVFGILLWVSDKVSMSVRRVEHLTILDAFIIGCAQAIALIPGTSRSGITMTAARFLGFERGESARFSFLLAVPAIAGAGLLKGLDALETGNEAVLTQGMVAAVLTFFFGLAAIAFLMSWLRRSGFLIFMLYRLGLGCFLIYLWANDFGGVLQ